MQGKHNGEGKIIARRNLTILLPLELRKEVEDIMYSERHRSLSNVAIDLMRLGLATRRGLELTKGEVKA